MNIKILQQNIDRNNNRVKELMDVLLNEKPQILFFSELHYSKHENEIIKRLEREKYSLVMPFEYSINCDKDSPCSCMMAMEEGINFKQRKRDGIVLSGRYIEGQFDFPNELLMETLFIHAPQTYVCKKEQFSRKDVIYYQDRVEQKAEMLFAIYHFWNEYKNNNVFIAGDFNTEINGSTRCENIFKAIYDDANDTEEHKLSWGNKCLDYALVSDSLIACECKTTRLKTTSDHDALLTEAPDVPQRSGKGNAPARSEG